MFHIQSKNDYLEQCKLAETNIDQFWGDIALEYSWFEKFNKVSDCDLSKAQISWFEGGKTNISYNCLDRHLEE